MRDEICPDIVGTYVDGAVRVVVRHLSEIVLDEARERAYAALAEITLEGSHYRRDIAARVAE